MAINRVDYPASTPASLTDWTDNISLHEASFLRTEESRRIDYDTDDVIRGAVFQIGGIVYLADSDTAITGTPSDYVKITPAGATASAAYVADLTGVSWNAVYNGWYDASGNLYVFDEGKAFAAGEITEVRGRYVSKDQDGNVTVEGALSTGGNVTVEGNEVVTTSSGTQTIAGTKTFSGSVDFTGQVSPRTDPVTGNQSISATSFHTPMRGFYQAGFLSTVRGPTYGDRTLDLNGFSGSMGGLFSGSGDSRIRNAQSVGTDWYYHRF